MSHYLGFVFVREPTREAVAKALAPFSERDGDNFEGKWDWYRSGGRWDGYLLGEDEMKRRQTHNGFNFDDANDDPARNSVKVEVMPGVKPPYFFLSPEGEWVERKSWDSTPTATSKYGEFVDNPDYLERYQRALTNKDWFVVVVDIHS